MRNIYQASLDAKFKTIMDVIAKEVGFGSDLNALTGEQVSIVENLAEQSVMNWAVMRKGQSPSRQPITNLQHLMDEYCAIADHL